MQNQSRGRLLNMPKNRGKRIYWTYMWRKLKVILRRPKKEGKSWQRVLQGANAKNEF